MPDEDIINIYIFIVKGVGKTTFIKTFLWEDIPKEDSKNEKIETIQEEIKVGEK